MRSYSSIFAVASVVASMSLTMGCTASPREPHTRDALTLQARPEVMRVSTSYRPVSAAALAFDPPMALEQPIPDISRDGRSPSAFVGYEDAVTSVYSVYQRDQIRSGPRGDFERSAYMGRTSVTTR